LGVCLSRRHLALHLLLQDTKYTWINGAARKRSGFALYKPSLITDRTLNITPFTRDDVIGYLIFFITFGAK
jgi:hypothetical protein